MYGVLEVLEAEAHRTWESFICTMQPIAVSLVSVEALVFDLVGLEVYALFSCYSPRKINITMKGIS